MKNKKPRKSVNVRLDQDVLTNAIKLAEIKKTTLTQLIEDGLKTQIKNYEAILHINNTFGTN